MYGIFNRNPFTYAQSQFGVNKIAEFEWSVDDAVAEHQYDMSKSDTVAHRACAAQQHLLNSSADVIYENMKALQLT